MNTPNPKPTGSPSRSCVDNRAVTRKRCLVAHASKSLLSLEAIWCLINRDSVIPRSCMTGNYAPPSGGERKEVRHLINGKGRRQLEA